MRELIKVYEAERLINHMLSKDGLESDYKHSITTILAENRRVSRKGNIAKYGTIPFIMLNGRAHYDKETIKCLYRERIKLIAKRANDEKHKKAAKAAEKRKLPYKDD